MTLNTTEALNEYCVSRPSPPSHSHILLHRFDKNYAHPLMVPGSLVKTSPFASLNSNSAMMLSKMRQGAAWGLHYNV